VRQEPERVPVARAALPLPVLSSWRRCCSLATGTVRKDVFVHHSSITARGFTSRREEAYVPSPVDGTQGHEATSVVAV
jgi:cold shock CspA family protein